MILLSGYPKLKIDESGINLIEKYCVSEEELRDIPKIGTEYSGVYSVLDILTLDSIDIEPDQGNAWLLVSLNYKSFQFTNSRQKKDGETEYRLSNGGIEKPIESHPGFKTRWKYYLASNSSSANIPDSVYNAVTTDDQTISGVSWRWYQTRSEIPEGWFPRLSPEKLGIESYILSSPIVIETKFFKRKRDADANARITGVRRVPGETFGIGGTAVNWLVMSCDIDFDGRYWRVTTTYQYADVWDTDIYPEG